MRYLTLIIVALLITISSHAAVITVKKDGTGHYMSIQAGYLAAASGDTVLVYPGRYYENLLINMVGKNITIASLNLTTGDKFYIYNTVVDGNKSGSTIRIAGNGQGNIVIHGFTIQNGTGYGSSRRGGGVYVDNVNPSIVNCIIENNISLYGGGISANRSLLYLSGTTIRNNTAHISGGGMIMREYTLVNFDTTNKCNIYLNHAGTGTDIRKSYLSPAQVIVLDTFTVASPDRYFILSADNMGNPVNDLNVQIAHGLIEPVKSDLFVDPVSGNDSNSGLTPDQALKTIDLAYKKILPDTLNSTTIFLANGTYSASTNGERFPVQGRSFVNLTGTERDNTILNAELKTYLFNGPNLNENYAVKNITLIKGSRDTIATAVGNSGMFFNFCHNISVNNILIKECASHLAKFYMLHSTNSDIKNIDIIACRGGYISISYSFPTLPTNFRIENLLAIDNTPYNYGGEDTGLGFGISGKLTMSNLFKGSVANLQVTNHMSKPDPVWGPRMCVGLFIGNHAIVDIVNATIGHNTVRGNEGYAVGLSEGAVLNLYNSILYADSLYEMVLGDRDVTSAPVTANICYSNIEGGPGQIYNWYNKHTLNWLEGNMDQDPEWTGKGKYPYQLRYTSPCINAGTPMYEEGMLPPYIKLEDDKIVLYKIDGDTLHLPPLDLAGIPRISGGRIDMGAYEFKDTGTYVPKNPVAEPSHRMHIYPNPFWVHTFISFKTQKAGKLVLAISDINGRPVKTLMDAQLPPGEFELIWKGNDNDGNNVPRGTYFITLYHNNQALETVKIVKQ